MHPFRRFVETTKSLPFFPGWSDPAPENHYSWFDVPLQINGTVEASFVLHGGCRIDRPDCNVTFELRAGRKPGRSHQALVRVCWKSLRGGHSNDRRWNSPLAGTRTEASHYHPFETNWNDSKQRLIGDNLPLACSMEAEINTYESLRTFTGLAFRINNIHLVSRPPWVYDLLGNGGAS